MLPVAGELLGLPIYSYGLAITVALGVCLALAFRLRERAGLTAADLLNCSLLGVAALLLAPKIWGMIVTGDLSLGAWAGLLSVWRQPEFSAGQVAAAAAAAWWVYARRRRIAVLPALDALLPVILLGLAIQRLGCFLAGCCYGRPTGLPWGVRFPADSPAGRAFPGEAVHPTQLYYLLAFLLVAGLLWLGRKRLRGEGMVSAGGFLGAGVAYAAITALRGDLAPGVLAWTATPSQWVALGFAAAGLALGARWVIKRFQSEDMRAESCPAGTVRRRS